MHRISVANDAPALVIAVPGAASPAADVLAERVAETTEQSCPGTDIRIGYLGSEQQSLAQVLADLTDGQPRSPRAVVVPLLTGPHPASDAAIAATAGQFGPRVLVAAHLGPHPLLAEALHDRLADVGLARPSRARGLNIATGANGVLLIADRGPEAVAEAGVTAVLLAARLAVPAAPASLGDPDSIEQALARLREAGTSHPAVAPCVIGPETEPGEISSLSVSIGTLPAAPMLGAHPAVSQLVAIRYGEALTRLAVASSPA